MNLYTEFEWLHKLGRYEVAMDSQISTSKQLLSRTLISPNKPVKHITDDRCQ